MALFRTQKTGFFFFSVLLLSLLLFQFLSIKQEKNIIFKGVYFLSGGIQTIKHKLHSSLSNTVKKYILLLEIQEENRNLIEQIINLKARQSLFEELKEENDRLNKMIRFQHREDMQLMPAQVIAYDFLFQNQLIVINRGAVHGIKKYMGVIHPQGIVGHVFRVTSHSSQIVTLMNKISSLPGLNQRSRVKGLMEPSNQNLLIFKYFDPQESRNIFQKGDKIITSSSEYFPQGLPIGVVDSIKETSMDEWRVLIKPAVLLSSLEEVFIILNQRKKDQ